MKAWYSSLLFVLVTGNAPAKEFPIFGPGASSCKDVLAESKALGNSEGTLDAVFQSWILGYLSGLNRSELIVTKVDSSEIAYSVYSYCSKNPDDSLFLVVDVLFDQLKTAQQE